MGNFTYKQVASKLEQLVQELRSRKSLKRENRLQSLSSILADFPSSSDWPTRRRYIAKLSGGAKVTGFHYLRCLLGEAMEFKNAFEQTDWSNGPDKQELGKWKTAVKGPLFLDNEDASTNDSRNTMLELSCAAEIRQRGYAAEFPSDGDLKVKVDDTVVNLECKRIFSDKKIAGNISKALKQLEERETTTPGGLILPGMKIVVVDFSPRFNDWFSERLERADETSDRVLLPHDSDLRRFLDLAGLRVNEIVSSWMKESHTREKWNDPSIGGIVLRVSAAGKLESDDRIRLLRESVCRVRGKYSGETPRKLFDPIDPGDESQSPNPQ